MAFMISLVALSIDAMLPALTEIGRVLGGQSDNESQLIISRLFLGMAIGQIFWGPLSDSFGRKRTIYAGLILFILSCLMSIFAQSFTMMLLSRFLQGVGVAGPRSVTLALVRDVYSGRLMARVMSFVMTVFMIVPILAPALGQGILFIADWRAIFWLFLVLAIIALIWLATRQPETHPIEKRTPFSMQRIMQAVVEVGRNRAALGYTISAGLISGPFLGYLSSSPQIFQDMYGLGAQFPLYFGLLAVAIGVASLSNARLVMVYGMRILTQRAILILSGLAILYFIFSYAVGGQPPLWSFMLYFAGTFLCIGVLFGNLNALAMEPLGHIAGVGAAVVGSLSTLISVPLGTYIGQAYNDTVLPLVGGYAVFGILTALVMRWAESKQATQVSEV
ncbi:MAG: multidrug effflux MFS transporter [Chloroflexota bacterium]